MTPAATPITIHEVWAQPWIPAPRMPEDDPFPAEFADAMITIDAEVTDPDQRIAALAVIGKPGPGLPDGICTVSLEALLAGEALVTIVPSQRERGIDRPHLTIKVTRKEDRTHVGKFVWFVAMLAVADQYRVEYDTRFGPEYLREFVTSRRDDMSAWSYVGLLVGSGRSREVRITPKSRITKESRAYLVIQRAIDAITMGRAPYDWQILNSGICARCGRTLTHPRSLETGIGPECEKLIAEGR